eukprot:6205095-Pleurochrysis_carterae.AAC.6
MCVDDLLNLDAVAVQIVNHHISGFESSNDAAGRLRRSYAALVAGGALLTVQTPPQQLVSEENIIHDCTFASPYLIHRAKMRRNMKLGGSVVSR